MLHKHIATCHHFIVRHHKYAWLLTGIAMLVVGGVYFKKEFISATTANTFTQSSWTGGVSADPATHASNQTGWNNYSATTTSITAGATVSLSVSALLLATGGFENGATSSTAVTGTGSDARVRLSRGAPASFQYLRFVSSNSNNRYLSLGEIYWVAGGVDYPTEAMTSHSSPSPLVVTYSDEGQGASWHAFNKNTGSSWGGNRAYEHWVTINFGNNNGIAPTGIGVFPYTHDRPESIEILASNTGNFTGEQVSMFQRSAVDWVGWERNNFTWDPPSDFVSSGTFTSPEIDLAQLVENPTLSWTATTTASTTISMQVRTKATLNGNWSGYSAIENGAGTTAHGVEVQYVQYIATLSTTDPSATPILNSVTINADVYTPGDITSSVYDTGFTDNGVSKIAWTATDTTSTEFIKFQVRSASTAEGLDTAEWCGQVEATGTCTGLNFFTATSGITMAPGTHPLNTGNDDRYIQYKASFECGFGLLTLTSVTITYGDEPPIITASVLGGTYASVQSITLSANEDSTIYYTTDGSSPTATSTEYTAAIPINATTVLKYFGIDTLENSSTVIEQIYTITTYVITESSFENGTSTVAIPSNVTNATINLSALAVSTETSTSVTIPGAIAVNASTPIGTISMAIPTGIQITAAIPDWDGTINALQIKSNSSVTVTPDSGRTATVFSVIEVGYGDVKLVFDKAVQLVFAGQAGKDTGYSRNSVFTKIGTVCSTNTQAAGDALPAEGDCKTSEGSDLIIWTKHFTSFVTYTQVATSGSSSSGGSYMPPPARILDISPPKPISTVPGCVAGDTYSELTGKNCFPVIVRKPVVPKIALVAKTVPTTTATTTVEPVPVATGEPILEPVLTPEPTTETEIKQNLLTKVISNIATTITNTISIVLEYFGNFLETIKGWFAR